MTWVSSKIGAAVALASAAAAVYGRIGEPLIGIMGAVILVAWGSEASLHGIRGFMSRFRVSGHVAGVVSSAFANVPEALIVLITGLRGVSEGKPELVEVAVLATMVAAGLNLLLLSLLVLASPGRGLGMEREAFRLEAPLLRVTVAAAGLIAFYGLLESSSGGAEPRAPPSMSIVLLLFYTYYAYRLGGLEAREKLEEASRSWGALLLAGLGATILASEALAGGVEALAPSGAGIPLTALLLGAAGSIPEHGLALLTVKRGMGSVGLGNLLGGASQSILIVYPLASLALPFKLDKYVTYQFAALAAGFWIILRCLSDDGYIDKSEASLIALLQAAAYTLLLAV